MQTESELQKVFNQDVDDIAQSFVDSYGLKHTQQEGRLAEPLLRWLDFVFRYIPPIPRQIFFSNKFPQRLAPEADAALQALSNLIMTGSDINPYQSKGLILHNDTSATKRQQRTDLLWADWGIHHLHLTAIPVAVGEYFSDRSKWLLFCVMGSDFVCFIDVRDHGEANLFSDPELLKTIAESWPEIMEQYRLKGISAPQEAHKSSDIAALRRGGVSSFIAIGSTTYMGPGMGLTTASTPTRVSLAMVKIRQYVRELAKIVADPAGQFRTESTASGIQDPEYGVRLTPQGLAVYEKHEDKAFLLPRIADSQNRTFLAELHDLVAPHWALKYVLSMSNQGPA